MKTYNSLSEKHKLFVRNLIEQNFNQTQAYLKTYPDSSYDAARANSSDLIAKNNIKQAIEERKVVVETDIDISFSAQLSRLAYLLEDADQIENPKQRAQLKLDILKEMNKMGNHSFRPENAPTRGSISISVDTLQLGGKKNKNDDSENDQKIIDITPDDISPDDDI